MNDVPLSLPLRFRSLLLAVGAFLLLAVAVDLGLRNRRSATVDPAHHVHGGEPLRGRQAILDYGCGACHVIPGVPGARGRVGPQLGGLREQIYIAGVLPNRPDNLIDWIREPRRIDPRTAMPNLGVAEEEARDMAAFLFHLP